MVNEAIVITLLTDWLAVELSSDFAHDETSTAMLTIGTNQYNKIFILFLFRKC
tara:strand:- start:377 stop:535 length:159 start_codon:yes stop_codon:yes gene_type:complete